MRHCAALHNTVFDTNIPTIGDKGFSLEKIVLWSTSRTGKSAKGEEDPEAATMGDEERGAVRFLERCLELDPKRRISAEEALRHEFLAEEVAGEKVGGGADEDDEVAML